MQAIKEIIKAGALRVGSAPVVDRPLANPEAELEQAFEEGAIVVCCWEPGCTMHRLPHWSEDEWISHPPRKKYARYSHGICRWHYLLYQQEIERFIAEEMPERRAVAAVS